MAAVAPQCRHRVAKATCPICSPVASFRNRLGQLVRKHRLKYKMPPIELEELIGIDPAKLLKKWGGMKANHDIDHIKPVASFDFVNHPRDWIKCWHYSNLRWIDRAVNNKKSDNWTKQDELRWRRARAR